eukprot:4843896-Pyramimonas_sp.AAC.1
MHLAKPSGCWGPRLLLHLTMWSATLGETVPLLDPADYTHGDTRMSCLTAPESDAVDDLVDKYESIVAGTYKPEGSLTPEGVKLLHSPLVVKSDDPRGRA